MVLFQLHDLVQRLTSTVNRKSPFSKQPDVSEEDFAEEMEALKKDLHVYLEGLEKFLNTKPWFIGEKISYVDFLAYEILDRYRELVEPTCLDKYEQLSGFMKRFESLEKLRNYLASDSYRKAAIYGPFSMLGNKRKDWSKFY